MGDRLVRKLWLPNLVSNAMIVYKADFAHEGNCAGLSYIRLHI